MYHTALEAVNNCIPVIKVFLSLSKREERIAKGAKIRKERPLRRDPMGNIHHLLGDRLHNRAKIILTSVTSNFSWVCLFVLAEGNICKYIFTTPTKDNQNRCETFIIFWVIDSIMVPKVAEFPCFFPVLPCSWV